MSEKQKLLGIAGAALGVCVLAGGGVFWANGLIDELQQTIAQKRTEIDAAEQKIAKIPASEKEVIILRENLGEYVKILPEDEGLNDFVKMLNQFEQSSGIQTIMFQPGRPSRNSKNPERFERIEYQYEMTATLWQFLKFMNSIENYERFVSITDFTITRVNGREAETRDGDVVHQIRLTMETYTYNSAGAGQDVAIPDYEDKKEMLREEIFKRMQAIRIDKYEHRGMRGRRDIFVDPREREGRSDGPPIEEQRAILERYVGELQRLRAVVNKLRKPDLTIFDQFTLDRELKEGIQKLEEGVAEVSQKQQISSPQLRLRWVKEVVEPLADMKTTGNAKDPRSAQDPYLSADEMQQLIDSMTQLMNEGDLVAADERFEGISPRLLVPESDQRYPLAVTAKALHVRVKTAIEFSSLDIRIQGVLVNHEGGRSGLLMNGETYEEGDYISDDLLLRRVEEEQVWFVFRGLTLIRTL
ncbi:MAG: type 4a pilus biogenesis protein PilO [Planctomycetota bacterium]